MTWQMYRWVWQLRSPLHVGYGPAGALNRTRLYIPARNMWAALTAEIAREQAGGATFPDYQNIGQLLQENFRFTYLYPAEQVNRRWLAWLPRYVQKENKVGFYWYREDGASLSNHRFRHRLLYTQPGTAIAPSTDTAEEGTLREVEYIRPFWQTKGTEEPQPVAFVGYLFLREPWPPGINRNTLQKVQELYVGGETRYGFGRLALVPYSDRDPWEHTTRCFDYEVDLTGDAPKIKVPTFLLAHALLLSSRLQLQGAWEALVYWDWQTMHSENRPLWQPGTRIEQPEDRKLNLTIGDDGLWRS